MAKAFLLIFLIVLAVETISAQGREGGRAKTGSQHAQASSAGKKVDLMKYRLDVDSNKYIRLGTTDKCPGNMRFFAVDGNETAGMCDCDYYQCSRPSIYSPQTKQCYFAWSQGPCRKGEWYNFDTHLKPVCEVRGCSQGLEMEPVTSETVSISYWFKEPQNGECYEAGTQGYCENEDETLLISPGEPIPKCRYTAVCVPLGRPEPQLCFPGNRRTHLGLCSEQ